MNAPFHVVDPWEAILSLVVTAIIGLSVVLWAWAVMHLRSGQPLLPFEPRQPVPWGVVDLLAIAGGMLCLQLLALRFAVGSEVLAKEGMPDKFSPDQLKRVLIGDSISKVLVITAAFVLLVLRTKARWRDLGLSLADLGRDLRLGVGAFAMLAVPMYGLQWILTRWFPSEHPLVTMLKERTEWDLLLLAAVAAVGVAPLVEEYLFRVFLQGWLENLCLFPHDSQAIVLGPTSRHCSTPAAPADESLPDSPKHSEVSDELASDFIALAETDLIAEGTPFSTAPRGMLIPILASAALFAWMHYGHGPDPIPLFWLAVGLGYLYQRTHRVVPCLVVHTLVNSFSLIGLWISIRHGKI